MDELKAIAEVINIGGNAALVISAWYIYKCEQAKRAVAERLARIESKLNLDQPKE